MTVVRRRLAALVMGVLCHEKFVAAVGSMAVARATGLQPGFGRAAGPAGAWLDLALVAQSPLLHGFRSSRHRRPARCERLFGERFVTYRSTVPYVLPRFRR